MRLSLSLAAAVVTVAIACSSTEPGAADGPGPSADAGASGRDAAREGSASTTADASDTPDAPTGPTPTKETSLASSMGGVDRTLVRAQFGNDSADTGPTVYLEAHLGGDPACPNEASPTTDYTLIVANVPRGAPGETFTLADGVAVTYFDFKGDQIMGGAPFRRATAATITIVQIDGDESVEIEVDATFAEGTVKGRAYATYCESLSG